MAWRSSNLLNNVKGKQIISELNNIETICIIRQQTQLTSIKSKQVNLILNKN